MKTTILKLGSKATDIATGLRGRLTTVLIDLTEIPYYCFQPEGVIPATGFLKESYWIPLNRIKDPKLIETVVVDLPVEVLGSQVTHDDTGVSGMAIGVQYHQSGCNHLDIQPKGSIENGNKCPSLNFEIHQCSGEMITKLTKAALAAERKEKPSPGPVPARGPRG